MELRNNRSGFTLLEIIIVIIIVGVLASLALPRFFKTVEFSKSAEALNALGVVRQAMERCYLQASSYSTCNMTSIDVEDPTNTPGSLFTYYTSNQSPTGYSLRAAFKTDATASWISLVQSATGVTRAGSGKFVGIQ